MKTLTEWLVKPFITEAPRVPRKKGQHRGSKSHSDLYTDENPKGTIKGLKFATVKDAQASVSKIKRSGKSHAHKIQAAVAMEQRAREMGKTSQAAVYRAFINKMKKKTKAKNEVGLGSTKKIVGTNTYTFGPDWIPTNLAQRKKMKRIHRKLNRSIREDVNYLVEEFDCGCNHIYEIETIEEKKWSTKYKKSINCSNPKGFSQKAHCAGRKKRKKNEDFAAVAGSLFGGDIPSPSQKKRKKAKKKLDKSGQRSVYSEVEIGESLPNKVTDKFKKVKNKPETDAEKDFTQHHKYSMSGNNMGSMAEPDTYDGDDDYKEKGGNQDEKPNKKKKGYEPVTEANEKITKVVGIYGGRFQPFGPHHLKTYQWLSKRVDDAYITTSNIKQPPRHPMNFAEKVRHMVKMGVPKNRIIMERSPYKAENVLKKYDEKTTAVVYVFGAKDAGRLKSGKYFQDYKKNKNKMVGYKDNGYVLTAPHVSIKIDGNEVSGTVMRKLLGSPSYETNREKLFRQAFGYFDKGVYNMMTNKFKKLFEFIDNNKDKVKQIIKEASGTVGNPVDDGPPTFHISFNDYRRTSKDWIEKTFEDLGFEVVDYMISQNAIDPLLDPSIRLNTVSSIAYGNLNTSKDVAIKKYVKNIEDRVLNNIGFEVVKWFGLKDDFSETTGVDVAQPILPGTHNADKNTELKEALNLDDEVKFLLEVDGMLLEEGVKFNNFLKDWSSKAKQPLDKVRKTMMNKNTFSIAKLNDFSVDKVLDNAKKGFKAYQKILNFVPDKVAKKLTQTKFGEKKEKSLKKLDNFLQKNPKLKKVMGVAAAAGITYGWTKMSFIGDPEYDLDLSDAVSAAAAGDYKMADLFSGEIGTKFLVLTAVGATTGLTAPYTKILGNVGTMAAGVTFGVARAIKKRRQKKDDVKKKTSTPDTVKNPNPKGRKKMVSKQSAVRWVTKNKGNKAAQKYQKSLSETKLFSPDWWSQELDLNPQKKELLLMGGAAGHMSHPFDDVKLTFGDFKKMINLSLEGKLSREDNVTEKLDGQNLMVSWVDGELRGARNKGHLKNNGKTSLNINGMKSVFSGRGDIEKAFVGAMKDLQSAVSKLSDSQKDKVFGNGNKWMNLEIVYPATANVIDYDVSELFFHGSVEVHDDGTVKSAVKDSARMLEGMIRQINQNIQKRFKISKPINLNLPKVQDFSKKKKYFLSKLRKLQTIYRLKDNDTLGMYHEMYWREFIFNGAKQHKYKIPRIVLESLVKRWAYFNKSFRLDNKSIKNDKFLDWAKSTDKMDHKKLAYENIKPFELLFLELGSEILKNLDGFLAVNPKQAVQKIKKELKSAITSLKTSKDIKKVELLKKNLEKIKAIGGVKAIVPSEGLVFKYKGKMYKYTGAFAPINQILGTFKFAR